MNKERRPAITKGRVYLALVIGLCVSAWLLVHNLTQVRYERVDDGTGNYSWVDKNENGQPDVSDHDEFKHSQEGNFIKRTYQDALGAIKWEYQSFFWIFLAVVMMFIRDLGYMIRIRILTDNELSWRQAFRVIMTWEFASCVTPGVVGGAAVAMFILRKENIALGRGTAVVMVTAMLDNLFYILMVPLLMLLVGMNAFFPGSESGGMIGLEMDLSGVLWFSYSVVALFFLFLLTGAVFRPVMVKRLLLFFFSNRLLRKWRPKALSVGNELVTTSREFKGKRSGFWLKAFGSTALSWTGRFLVINCLVAAFIHTDLFDQAVIFARQLGMWVIMIVSPTPGGTGIAEYTFSEFLGSFIPFGFAGFLAILWRLISYYPYLFIGSFLLPGLFGKKNVKTNKV